MSLIDEFQVWIKEGLAAAIKRLGEQLSQVETALTRTAELEALVREVIRSPLDYGSLGHTCHFCGTRSGQHSSTCWVNRAENVLKEESDVTSNH